MLSRQDLINRKINLKSLLFTIKSTSVQGSFHTEQLRKRSFCLIAIVLIALSHKTEPTKFATSQFSQSPSVNGHCLCSGNGKRLILDGLFPDIMYNVDQQLFDYCTAKFSDNTQCCVPVFDIRHELPLCPEHAAKAVSLLALIIIVITLSGT